MKKFYLTLFAALLTFGASARELKFYNGDQEIENGSTITFENITVNDNGDWFEVEMKPDLYVSYDIYSKSVDITAECLSGQTIQMCAGGGCMRGTTVTKTGVTLQTKQKLELKFDYADEFDAGETIPTVTTLITAVDTKYPATEKSFTIIMGQNVSSVDVIENNSDITLTPAGIVYTLTTPTDFAIYNITGKQVVATQLNGTGLVETSKLAKGIYIYRAGAVSGKFIVK